ncbi:LacI family transcriptional regulator [Paraoerskovia sediminicola]|uniref:LacI family transcriptional regulator n=1 Tax=Paraoerskovia sediminicola TaxID=1138587 RepID=A0ABM8G1C6_9CELL|nr:LacI family DNA-binding transcriptional regulator [Paraoerskovia sediminicola]BDZ41888.1 LacI family transcriptional regulator [Paraoerskovia sediminicola]
MARAAGVSAKTVSRVVSGESNVAPATRDSVLEAALALQFRPNRLARSLRTGGVTTTIGFVVGDLSNPFYAAVAAGVERELARHGMTMLLAATEDDPAAERTVVGALLAERVRGLLLVPTAPDQSYLEAEQRLGTPVVTVDRPAHGLVADSVVLEDARGAHEATTALIDAGHRDIAFLGTSGTRSTQQHRRDGFRSALADAGLAAQPGHDLLGPYDDGLDAAARDLLAGQDRPTAVLTGDNRASASVVRALGTDLSTVAVVGFDDFELADALGISVVAYDAAAMGRQAARCLLDRLGVPADDAETELADVPPRTVLVPTRLERRGSLASTSTP